MPTPAGWCTLAAGAVLYAAGSLLGYPELAVLAVGCALAVAGAVAWTLPQPRLRVRREVAPRSVARGQPALGAVTLHNPGRRSPRLRAEEPCGGGVVAIELPAVPARGRRLVSYRLPTDRRGPLAVGPLRLVRTDPLALASRRRECAGRLTVLVRPRVTELPVPPLGRAGGLDGTASGPGRGSPVAFHGLREYVPGDELRLVHWRSSAHTGRLLTRELRDADRPHATVVLDVWPGSYDSPAAFELAVEAAASIAVAAARRGQPLRAVLGAGPPVETSGAGRREAERLLDRLALVATDPAQRLETALRPLGRSRTAGLLAVVTGRLPAAAGEAAGELRGRFDRVLVVLTDPGGAAPAEPAGVGWIDGSSPEALVAGWRRAMAR
jgi:uncharacterized protein (DUF58 family)